MKSLRLFFTSKGEGNGQLVIASQESQYKIFHFHHGGLDKLAKVLEELDFLHLRSSAQREAGLLQFSVALPIIRKEECHPEEGSHSPLDESTWNNQILDKSGRVEDDLLLRKMVFFGGICPLIRKDVWPFLLRRFPYNSTFKEREAMREMASEEYKELNRRRESMSNEEKEVFWRSVECTVSKDVPRTDRSNPFFSESRNLESLKRILLNYALYNPGIGYTQGMSDLVAPLLIQFGVEEEPEVMAGFKGLMENTLFVSSPRDIDMDSNLFLLGQLLKLMNPRFHDHLNKLPDQEELLFTHRWILLCFKREFPSSDALKIWETCWAHYQTDYFHLFICLAIISLYGKDVVEQDFNSDEILFHFSTLSGHMDSSLVLRKARGLLHQFRSLARIPCTLASLCHLCGPGDWDSTHLPSLECLQPDGPCPRCPPLSPTSTVS